VRLYFCALLLLSLVSNAAETTTSPLILQLRVVEGEGASYPAGSRAVRGLTVEVTDEAGQPVPSAAVSFRLPESGATGLFANGTRTEIVSSGPNGRATVWGMKWNRLPGEFSIRVTAAKGETRAGALVRQALVEPSALQSVAAGAGKQDFARYKVRRGKRWIWLSALAAGAAGGGLAFGARTGGKTTGPVAGVGITIGSPRITVGR
jgi:hypothetical protein